MNLLKILNLGIRFALELFLLVSLAIASFNVFNNQTLKWTATIGLPVIAMAIWGVFIAPKSNNLLDQPYRLIVELVLFGGASFLLYKAGYPVAAITFISIVLINELLLLAWKQ